MTEMDLIQDLLRIGHQQLASLKSAREELAKTTATMTAATERLVLATDVIKRQHSELICLRDQVGDLERELEGYRK